MVLRLSVLLAEMVYLSLEILSLRISAF